MKYLIATLLLCVSCVTPGQFQDLKYRFDLTAIEQAQVLEDLDDDKVSVQEANAQITQLQEDFNQQVEDLIEEAFEVPQVVAGQVLGGAAKIGTGDIIGGVSGILLALTALYAKTKSDAVAQVNVERDAKYKVGANQTPSDPG